MSPLEAQTAEVEDFKAEKAEEINTIVQGFSDKYGALRAGIDEVSLADITKEQVEIGGVTYLKNNEGNLVRLDSLTQKGFANISDVDKKAGGMHTHSEWEQKKGITHSEFKDYYGEDFQNLQNLITEYSESFDGFSGAQQIAENLSKKFSKINSKNLDVSGKQQYVDMQKNIADILGTAM